MSKIFLSHSHKDKDFVRILARDLRRRGHIAWVDEAEIQVGDSLIDKISEGLEKVDYVAAIISKHSIRSVWVKRELDIAMNMEIERKRVLLLPLLIGNVEPPTFLRGKLYLDFRNPNDYSQNLSKLLRRLGPAVVPPKISDQGAKVLKPELQEFKKIMMLEIRKTKRHKKLTSEEKSPELRKAINQANKQHPEHKAINEAYAFEVSGQPITMDYLLWVIDKRRRRGKPQPLEFLIELEGKWGNVYAMLEAYADYMGINQE